MLKCHWLIIINKVLELSREFINVLELFSRFLAFLFRFRCFLLHCSLPKFNNFLEELIKQKLNGVSYFELRHMLCNRALLNCSMYCLLPK